MRTAQGLLDDLVDHAELAEVTGGEAQGLGGVLAAAAVAPEDARAALGRDDGVVAVLQHQHAVAHADAERATAAALADDDADRRDGEAAHLEDVLGDGPGLAALLGADAGVRTRGVDERDDGQAEAGGQLHLRERLAVALGVRHAELALEALAGVAALAVADDQEALVADAGEARGDGLVFAEEAIAVELDVLVAEVLDVVRELGTAGMAGDQAGLPRGEVLVRLLEQTVAAANERLEFAGKPVVVIACAIETGARDVLELFDLLLELEDRTLEGEGSGGIRGRTRTALAVGHGDPSRSGRRARQ